MGDTKFSRISVRTISDNCAKWANFNNNPEPVSSQPRLNPEEVSNGLSKISKDGIVANSAEIELDGRNIHRDVEEESLSDSEETFPEGGLRAWSVVLGAFLLILPSWGFQVSIGTLQDYWHQNQLLDYSARDVGWILSVFVYLPLAGGLLVGPLFDRFGPRYILLIGTVLYIAMMFLLAECKLYWHFMLCCGFLGGISGAMITTTSLASVSHWFKERRALATGVAMAGSSLGGVSIPLILRQCLPLYGYQWSIRIIGFTFTGSLILGNLLIKARIPPSTSRHRQAIISLRLFADLRLSLLAISVFAIEVVLFGGLGILPTYATLATDFPPETGFYLIAVLNGASTFGRVVPGYTADKIGRFNMLLLMMVFTLVFMLTLWLPFGTTSISALYAFSAIFGFGTGAWMALVPACVGQLCRSEDFGRYFGSLYFIAGLSTLICIPISGELVQNVGPQAMVGFFCAVLAIGIVAHVASRMACLGWRWHWTQKV